MTPEASRHPRAVEEISPAALRESLDKLGVGYPILDFDGTLIDSLSVFLAGIDSAIQELCPDPERIPEFNEQFLEMVGRLRLEFHVNREILLWPTHITARQLGLPPDHPKVRAAETKIHQIYDQDPYPLLPGAKETVIKFFEAGLDPIMVTHAGERYTERKLRQTGLAGMFKEVVCLSVDRPKRDQWSGCFQKLAIPPEKVLMIGDNWKEDIEPTVALGTRGVWINSKPEGREFGRNNHRLSEEGEGRVLTVNSIGAVIESLVTAGNSRE
ncbi:MAG: HAD family hydrolase [Patescibacteria group bacterium]|nr:HAD family hydrolase [Patescibacteria group bacterium]